MAKNKKKGGGVVLWSVLTGVSAEWQTSICGKAAGRACPAPTNLPEIASYSFETRRTVRLFYIKQGEKGNG